MKQVIDIQVNTELIQMISAEQARHYRVIPYKIIDEQIEFLSEDSANIETYKEELELILDHEIQLTFLDKDSISKLLAKYYRLNNSQKDTQILSSQKPDDFLVKILTEANNIECSDIHFESYHYKNRVRFRVDGSLIEKFIISSEEYPALINKIKIRANLDISEKRLPQDGRIHYVSENQNFDIRVSSIPVLDGEKVVLRLLRNNSEDLSLESIGLSSCEKKIYKDLIHRSQGIILISGPTGSGKTTTLYATLKELNNKQNNIITVEDPVEYTLDGINQVQVKEKIGLDFPKALRSILRQDPDIIMVGEIRDKETASIAIRAAMTGHLVLSTIHTNSAWGSISRLMDMGIPPFLLKGTINLTVAQRLLRKLCPSCKSSEALKKATTPSGLRLETQITSMYTAPGCDACYYTGYKGRHAIFELIPINEKLADEIGKSIRPDLSQLHQQGLKSLSENALDLLNRGISSLEEIYPILQNHN